MKLLNVIVRTLGLLVLAGSLFFVRVPSVHAQASDTCSGIQYGAFTRSVAFIEAQKQGFFAQEGLNVCYNQVISSTQQFDSLFAGQYDIISTTADNVVNRFVNAQLPVQILAGIDQGAGLSLIVNTANGIHSFADLKGKTVAVDAPNSGFVFALEKMLAANGLSLANNDYSFQIIGGSLQRFNAIAAGHTTTGAPVYATILGTPFSEQAHTVPTLSDLGSFSTYVAPYQGTSLATTRGFAQAHPDTVTAFIKATIRGRNFAALPANKDTVIADIASTFNVSSQIATEIYNDSQKLINGENLGEALNPLGLINTIKLRQEFGGFAQAVNPVALIIPGKTALYDPEYWANAWKQILAEEQE